MNYNIYTPTNAKIYVYDPITCPVGRDLCEFLSFWTGDAKKLRSYKIET